MTGKRRAGCNLRVVVILAGLVVIVFAQFAGAAPPEPPISPVTTPTTDPPDKTQLLINPPRVQVVAGDTKSTEVRMATARSVYTVKFWIRFDPHIVAVVDTHPELSGVQIQVDPLLVEQGVTVGNNWVDNQTGVVQLSLAQSNSSHPLNAADALAHITWQGVNEGTAELALVEVELAGADDQSLNFETHTGTIRVMAAQPPLILGRVLLQGRSRYGATKVYVTDRFCADLPNDGIWTPPGDLVAVTDVDGYFEIVQAENRQYRCLQVFQRGYLVGQKRLPRRDLGTITLPGGDVNTDDIINIFDLAGIGSYYGDNQPRVDINNDGVVSIFDLVMAASNYGRRGPVTDWR